MKKQNITHRNQSKGYVQQIEHNVKKNTNELEVNTYHILNSAIYNEK